MKLRFKLWTQRTIYKWLLLQYYYISMVILLIIIHFRSHVFCHLTALGFKLSFYYAKDSRNWEYKNKATIGLKPLLLWLNKSLDLLASTILFWLSFVLQNRMLWKSIETFLSLETVIIPNFKFLLLLVIIQTKQ